MELVFGVIGILKRDNERLGRKVVWLGEWRDGLYRRCMLMTFLRSFLMTVMRICCRCRSEIEMLGYRILRLLINMAMILKRFQVIFFLAPKPNYQIVRCGIYSN